MAIRKSNDIANESGDEYAKSKSASKVANITERFDDSTDNDNPFDDAIQYINKKIDECVDEINLSDSSKVITSDQAAAIVANTRKTVLEIGVKASQAKAGNTTTITTSQASAITANTAKTGISSDQTEAIVANTAKVGTTSTERSRIAANHAKVGITTSQASAISANTSKTGITSTQAGHITANNNKVGFVTTMPTATEGHSVELSVTNTRGTYALVFTMIDSTGKSAVKKTATIALE